MLPFFEEAGLLRRGVLQLPEEHARLGEALPAVALGELLGDAEVDDLDQQLSVMVLRQHDVLGRDVAVDEAHRVEMVEAVQGLDGDLHGQARRDGAVLGDPLLDVRPVDELPHHVVGAVVEGGEVIQHGQVLVLDRRRRAGFLEKALQALIVRGDVGAHDLDHAQLVEVDVADLEDLSHAADAEPVEDLVLPVEQARRVGPLEHRHALAAVGTLLQRGVDGLFALEAVELRHGWFSPGVAWLQGCWAAQELSNVATQQLNDHEPHNCTKGPHRTGRRPLLSTSPVRRGCCSRMCRWPTSDPPA